MASIINASTSSGLVNTADTSGILRLQSNGVTQQTVDSTGSYGQLKLGTVQASTSGTSIDFTGIPSWAKRITVMFNGVSTNGTSNLLIQVGSGSVTTTGYNSLSSATSSTVGLIITNAIGAASAQYGSSVLTLISSNAWTNTSMLSSVVGGTSNYASGASPSLGGTLDRVRITTVNGTDTFDAGSINIMYEG